MKKTFKTITAILIIFALAFTAGATLPDVDVGREITVVPAYFSIGDDIVKKAGITLTRPRFNLIKADLENEWWIDVSELTFENITDYTIARAAYYNTETVRSLEADIIELLGDPFFGFMLADFAPDFFDWLRHRRIAAGTGIPKLNGFDIALEVRVPFTHNVGYIENLHGGSFDVLLEIPEEMRGEYDYFIFGIKPGDDYDSFGLFFLTVNNGNALDVIDELYIAATLKNPGGFWLAAFPKASSEPYIIGDVNNDGFVDSSDALEILKYEIGLPNVIEGNPRAMAAADVNGDGSIDSSDALEILKYEIGLPSVFG
ncbi:MAG: dockerin type I repeat-containing protein [Oscillospiraceae bacterium]|nr:dockerin type I repeat-containing protein [Oscillospiraceae bacterium]